MSAAKPHARALLALDGRNLSRQQLGKVLRHCVHLCRRLDILVVDPPRALTSILAMLLLQLEHSGIDYQVASGHGHMGEEVSDYLSRYRGISVLAVFDLEPLGEAVLAQAAEQGVEIQWLGEPD